ncbi:MAG: hypothetical protein GVY30_01440 [Chloroflexi bacterium]|jgi:fatty acid-binding protein DegV|nr:hypothetical protein [Chloroflexota bacterium]
MQIVTDSDADINLTPEEQKGLIASIRNLKPLLGVEKVNGAYVQLGQARTFKRAVRGLGRSKKISLPKTGSFQREKHQVWEVLISGTTLVDLIEQRHAPGSALRVQVLHSQNPEGAALLRDLVDERFDCTWLPVGPMSLVLGAHTGRSMVGVASAPLAAFADVP